MTFSTSLKGQLFKAVLFVATVGIAFGVLREKGYLSFSDHDAVAAALAPRIA